MEEGSWYRTVCLSEHLSLPAHRRRFPPVPAALRGSRRLRLPQAGLEPRMWRRGPYGFLVHLVCVCVCVLSRVWPGPGEPGRTLMMDRLIRQSVES